MQSTPLLTKEEIIEGLRRVGIDPGDLVFCHTSIRSFGARIPGGASGLLEATLEVVSPGGTVAAPTHCGLQTDKPFDPATSPISRHMGIFPQVLLDHHGAVRSCHPTHSDAAVGAQSQWLLEGHEISGAVGTGSPLDRIRLHPYGKIILFGVDYTRMTILHLPEYLANLPYIDKSYSDSFPDNCEVKKDGRIITVSLAGRPGNSAGFNAVEPLLKQAGLVRETHIAQSRVRVIPAGPAVEIVVKALEKDPALLLAPPEYSDYYRRAHELIRNSRRSI
jgi:aminoglycoside N3'-acetyltransferase